MIVNETLRLVYVEHRYDEPLALAFGLRFYPSVYVLDKTGMVY